MTAGYLRANRAAPICDSRPAYVHIPLNARGMKELYLSEVLNPLWRTHLGLVKNSRIQLIAHVLTLLYLLAEGFLCPSFQHHR